MIFDIILCENLRVTIVQVHYTGIRVKAGLSSFDRCCGLFLDLAVCRYIVYAMIQLCMVYLKRFVQNFWRVEKYVPFRFGRTLLCLKVPGNRSDVACRYSPGLNLYGFQISRTLVDAQGVIQQPTCLNMARAMHEANLRQTLLGG